MLQPKLAALRNSVAALKAELASARAQRQTAGKSARLAIQGDTKISFLELQEIQHELDLLVLAVQQERDH